MTIKYFKNVETLDDLKSQYRKLMMQYHPDRNPSNVDEATRISKIINNEYEHLFERVKNIKRNKDGATYKSYQETSEKASEYMDIIDILMKYNNITIDIVGSWLWVGGETFQIKDVLKGLNFKYAPSKKRWYLIFGEYHKKTKNTYSYEAICQMFGCEEVKKPEHGSKILLN